MRVLTILLMFSIDQSVPLFFKAVRVPTILLEPRAAHLPRHEEADPVGPVRVPQPRVEECVQRCQRAHQGEEDVYIVVFFIKKRSKFVKDVVIWL